VPRAILELSFRQVDVVPPDKVIRVGSQWIDLPEAYPLCHNEILIHEERGIIMGDQRGIAKEVVQERVQLVDPQRGKVEQDDVA